MKKLLVAGVGDLNKRVALGWNQLGGFVEGARLSQADSSLGFKQHSLDLSVNLWPDTQAMTICVALSARERTIEAYRKAYVLPIQQLLKSIPHWQFPPERVIVVSSTRVYGESDGEEIDDNWLAQSNDEYGQILLEMEGLVGQLPCESTVVRLSGIYGPGRDWLKRMAVKASEEAPATNHWTNRIHIEDAAFAILHLANLNKVEKSYIVSDTAPTSWCDMLNYLRELMNLPSLTNCLEVKGGKKLIPSGLIKSGFKWKYPTAKSGGYVDAN